MCNLKRKSVSIVIPKSMTEFTFCKGMLLIWMDCDVCDWPIWRMLHLECEICICHTEDQTCIFSSSCCRLFWVWLVYSVYNLMSSAKSLTVVLGLKWSVIYRSQINWIIDFQSNWWRHAAWGFQVSSKSFMSYSVAYIPWQFFCECPTDYFSRVNRKIEGHSINYDLTSAQFFRSGEHSRGSCVSVCNLYVCLYNKNWNFSQKHVQQWNSGYYSGLWSQRFRARSPKMGVIILWGSINCTGLAHGPSSLRGSSLRIHWVWQSCQTSKTVATLKNVFFQGRLCMTYNYTTTFKRRYQIKCLADI